MANSTIQKVVEKLIAALGAVSSITSVVPASRIYGAHPATIQDVQFPAISMHVLEGSRLVTEGGHDILTMQIDVWMKAKGTNAKTWDDVMTLWADILSTLHGVPLTDSNVKILQIVNVGQGPQQYEPDTDLLHLSTRWRVRATA